MRLSEKTIELNFASQMNWHFGGRLIWFGLTQKQEARAGFDIATRVGSSLFIVQMKSSNRIVERWDGGRTVRFRQFRVSHRQLQNLLRHSLPPRSVFYGLPALGTTLDLSRNPDVYRNTWLCDVASLGSIGGPTIERGPRRGSLRADGCHYVDVEAADAPIGATGTAIFRSDPLEVEVRSGPAMFPLEDADAESKMRTPGLLSSFDSNQQFEAFWNLCEYFKRKAFALIVVNQAKVG